MRKAIIFIALFAGLSYEAKALDLELGVGYNTYNKQPDGVWYQENLPNWIDLNSTSLSVGVSEKFGSLRYRAEFVALGSVFAKAIVTASDLDYNPVFIHNCQESCNLRNVMGRGSVSGAVLSVSRDFKPFGAPLYVEGGAFVYVPKWQVTITPVSSADGDFVREFAHNAGLQIGPMLGVGFRYDGADIGIRYLYTEATGDMVPGIYTSAITVTFKAYF